MQWGTAVAAPDEMLHPSSLIKDLRFAVRILRRSPLFTIVAVCSLALGIGGSAAVFALVNAILLRALPVAEPDRLFVADRHLESDVSPRFSWPAFERRRDELAGRAELCAAGSSISMQLKPDRTGGAPAGDRGTVQLVSGEYFEVLRQRPQLGRLLTPADNANVGAAPVAVISDGYWRRQLGHSVDVVGRSLTVNGTPLTIVGVAAPEFFGTTVAARGPDVWVPIMLQPVVRYGSNASSYDAADPRKPWPPQEYIDWLQVFARVPRGSDPAAIAAAMTARQRADARTLSGAGSVQPRLQNQNVTLVPAARGISSLRQTASAPLLVLLGIMGILLLIACGNVAGLLVARGTAREREMAIRLSLGAGRGVLVRQLLVESLLLGICGGLVGLAVALWGRDLLLRLFISGTTFITLDTHFDWRVLTFAAGLSIATGIICGLIPAFRVSRVPISDSLKVQARSVGTDSRRTLWIGKTLVAAQMAFCLLVLVVAGLFIRSLRVLASSDIGYDRSHVLTARLDVRSLGYSNEQRLALYRRILDRVQAIPGVVSASISQNGPLGGSSHISSFTVEGYTAAPRERLQTNEEIVTDAYFGTVGLRILRGRAFAPEDRTPGSHATLINETMARRYFAGRDPIGKRWSYDDGGRFGPDAFVIIGVVEDAKYRDLKLPPPNMAYHLADVRDDVLSDLEARSSGTPEPLIGTIRQALAEAEPQLPLYDVVPLADRVARNLSQDTVVAQLSSIFGAIALLLACLGLYGTISYGVTQRTSELGLRLALGAERRRVLWIVLREAIVLLVIGGGLGLPLTYAASRGLGSLLYGVPPLDPVSYTTGALLLATVGLLAAYLPAYRASRIEPIQALTNT